MALQPTDIINIRTEKIKQLLISVRRGLPIRIALDRAGIPTYTYYTWLNLYNAYINDMESRGMYITDDNTELDAIPIYSTKDKNVVVGYRYTPISIITTIKRENASWVEEKHTNINNSTSNKDWQSQAFLLERRVKSEYSKEETLNTNTEKVEKVIVGWIDPKEQEERLKKLEEEVKEALNGNNN